MKKLKTHNDLDGVSPYLLADIAFGEEVEPQFCSYGNFENNLNRFLEKHENKGVELIITDISPKIESEELLRKIQEKYAKEGNVVLIDHHKTAEELNKYSWAKVITVYEDGRKTCATSLFYEYLIEKGLLKQTQILDEYVELVRQYDTWEWAENKNKKAKQLNDLFYMIGHDNFIEKMKNRLKESGSFYFDHTEEMLLNMEEEKIERYLIQKQKQMIETNVFEYRVGIVHGENYHSELGNYLGENNPHLDLVVILNDGAKRISYRTIHDSVDVSEFAKRFGGGGHPKASGSELDEEALRLFHVEPFCLAPRREDYANNKYNLKQSPYGTFYENHQGERITIFPSGENWKVEFEGYMEGLFNDFQDAESFVKRNHSAWLAKDDVLVEYYATKYQIKEQTIRSQFEKTMEKISKGLV